MNGWPPEPFCWTCFARATSECEDHHVQLVHLVDGIGPWRDRDERLARVRENEARMLGEAA